MPELLNEVLPCGINLMTEPLINTSKKCSAEFREENAVCSVHGVQLKEIGAIINPGSTPPQGCKPTSYLCPESGQHFPYIKFQR